MFRTALGSFRATVLTPFSCCQKIWCLYILRKRFRTSELSCLYLAVICYLYFFIVPALAPALALCHEIKRKLLGNNRLREHSYFTKPCRSSTHLVNSFQKKQKRGLNKACKNLGNEGAPQNFYTATCNTYMYDFLI